MASDEPCSRHDHGGGGDLRLTLDEVGDVVRDAVRGMVGDDGRLKGPDALAKDDERARLDRAELQLAEVERRRATALPTWRERLWGGG
jgi:hypothetical protein